MNLALCRTLAIGFLCVGLTQCKHTQLTSSEKALTDSNKIDLVINVSGKGSLLPWDIGAYKAAAETLPAVREGRSLLIGNSSAAIFAAYVSCFGSSPEAISRAEAFTQRLTPELLAEDVRRIQHKMMVGGRPEMEWTYLKEFIDGILRGPDGKACTPKYPVVITAANGDVIDSREARSMFTISWGWAPASNGTKTWADGTYDVFEKQANGSAGKPLGKACTAFATPGAAAMLERVPPNERMCELRTITTPEELLFAVMASCAEPTYYYPVQDINLKNTQLFNSGLFYSDGTDPYWLATDPSDTEAAEDAKKLKAFGKDVGSRYYIGGFLVINGAQDIVRADPGVRVLNITRPPLTPAKAFQALMMWYTIDVEESFQRNRWFADLEILPGEDQYSGMCGGTIPRTQFGNLGYAAAKACLQSDTCFAKDVIAPKFDTSVDGSKAKIQNQRGLRSVRR